MQPTDQTGMEEAIEAMVQMHRVAVVGLSDDPSKPSHRIAEYLAGEGKEVFGVNPTVLEVELDGVGRRVYAAVEHVPGPLEVVCVFRRPEYCAEVARVAVEAGAKGVWLQSGIRSAEARKICQEAGVLYVEDHCLMVEHAARAG